MSIWHIRNSTAVQEAQRNNEKTIPNFTWWWLCYHILYKNISFNIDKWVGYYILRHCILPIQILTALRFARSYAFSRKGPAVPLCFQKAMIGKNPIVVLGTGLIQRHVHSNYLWVELSPPTSDHQLTSITLSCHKEIHNSIVHETKWSETQCIRGMLFKAAYILGPREQQQTKHVTLVVITGTF